LARPHHLREEPLLGRPVVSRDVGTALQVLDGEAQGGGLLAQSLGSHRDPALLKTTPHGVGGSDHEIEAQESHHGPQEVLAPERTMRGAHGPGSTTPARANAAAGEAVATGAASGR